MAVTIDQVSISSGTAASPANPWTVNTTVTAAAGAYLVFGVTWFSTTTTVTGVTFGGSPGTILIQGKSGGRSACLVGFPATAGLASGSAIAVTATGALIDASRGCMSLLGVDTTTPITATSGPTANTGTNVWASASNTLPAGGALISSAFQEGFSTTNNTPAAGTLESYDLTSDGNGSVLVYRIEAAGGSYTVGGTWTAGTTDGVNVAVVVNPAGGAAVTEYAAPWKQRPPGHRSPASRIWVPFKGAGGDPIAAYTGSSTITETVAITSAGGTSAGSSVNETVSITSSGAAGGSVSVPIAVGITASGQVSAGSAITETVAITSTGATDKAAGATITETVGITSAGATGLSGSSSISETVSITSTGATGTATGATVSETFSVTSAGVVTTGGNVNITETVSITATGVVGKSTGSTLTETVSITATGVVGKSTGATVTETVSITATGVVATSAGVTITETVTITTTGAGPATVNRVETVAITATGSTGVSKSSSISETFSITAAGVVNKSAGATRAETVTITTTGGTGLGGSISETVTITSTGGVSGGAALTETVSITADGFVTPPLFGDAQLTETFTLTATGHVLGNHRLANIRRLFIATYETRHRTVAPEDRHPEVPPAQNMEEV